MRLRPSIGITVMLWLKLDNILGDQEIFMTTNPENPGNKHGQYHFQVNTGSVRWFHRNTQSQVFEVRLYNQMDVISLCIFSVYTA